MCAEWERSGVILNGVISNFFTSRSDVVFIRFTAFNTVDHSILLYRLRHTISLSDSVYNRFSSYLTGRMEYVAL